MHSSRSTEAGGGGVSDTSGRVRRLTRGEALCLLQGRGARLRRGAWKLLLREGYSPGSPGIFSLEKVRERRTSRRQYQDPQRGGLRLPVRAMSTVESGSVRTNIFAEIGHHIEQELEIVAVAGAYNMV